MYHHPDLQMLTNKALHPITTKEGNELYSWDDSTETSTAWRYAARATSVAGKLPSHRATGASPLLYLPSLAPADSEDDSTASKVPHHDSHSTPFSPGLSCPVWGGQPLIKTGLAGRRQRKSAHLQLLFSPRASVWGLKTREACFFCSPPQDPQHRLEYKARLQSPLFLLLQDRSAHLNTFFFIITSRSPMLLIVKLSSSYHHAQSLEHNARGPEREKPLSHITVVARGDTPSQEFWAHFPLKALSLMVTLFQYKLMSTTGYTDLWRLTWELVTVKNPVFVEKGMKFQTTPLTCTTGRTTNQMWNSSSMPILPVCNILISVATTGQQTAPKPGIWGKIKRSNIKNLL